MARPCDLPREETKRSATSPADHSHRPEAENEPTHPVADRPRSGKRVGLSTPATLGAGARASAGDLRRHDHRRHGAGLARAGDEPPTDLLPAAGRHSPRYTPPAGGGSVCEWKGRAPYLGVVGPQRRAERVAWAYPKPIEPFAGLADHVAFYAGSMDACFVGEERVTPQPGGFYGGWVTRRIVGPFKDEPGTMGW